MNFLKVSLFIIIFFVHSVPIFAEQSEFLYLIKNSNNKNIKNLLDFYSRQKNFLIIKSDDSFSKVSISDLSNDFYIYVIKQNNNDVYLYFFSPNDKSKICKEILQRIKINGYKYSKSDMKNFNTEKYKAELIINNNNFDNNISVEKSLHSDKITTSEIYDFSDDAQRKYNQTHGYNYTQPYLMKYDKNNKNKQNLNTEGKYNKEIFFLPKAVISKNGLSEQITTSAPVNITIPVILQSTINTSSLDPNDRISAILRDDLYINNKLIAKQGSIVYGTIIQIKKAGMAYSDGAFNLVFDKILTTDGDELIIQSEPLMFKKNQTHRGAKIAGNVAASVLLSTAVSALFTTIEGNNNWARNLSAGAASGAVIGGLSLLGATGEDVELKEGTVLFIKAISLQ